VSVLKSALTPICVSRRHCDKALAGWGSSVLPSRPSPHQMRCRSATGRQLAPGVATVLDLVTAATRSYSSRRATRLAMILVVPQPAGPVMIMARSCSGE
jgi:hypothetical protein